MSDEMNDEPVVNQTFEITLKLIDDIERHAETICCRAILADHAAPFVGEQIGEIVATALRKLFPDPWCWAVTNLRTCVDTISASVYETHNELFKQFPEEK